MSSLACALLSGLLLTLATPPISWWPVGLVALVPLIAVTRNATVIWAAFLWGAAFFFAFGLTTAWWIPLLQRFAGLSAPWAMATGFAIFLWQALPYAGVGAFGAWVGRGGVSGLMALPLATMAVEQWFPFPFKGHLAITVWNAWPLTQIAEWGGPPAVSGMVVLGAVLLVESFCRVWRGEVQSAGWRAIIVGWVVIITLIGLGLMRAMKIEGIRNRSFKASVGIVQPNSGPLSRAMRERHGQRVVDMLAEQTRRLADEGADLVVWPESAWPFLLDRRRTLDFPVGHPWRIQRGRRVPVLFGSLTAVAGQDEVFNSVLLLDGDGRMSVPSDKSRLVPFAERIPLASRFPEWAARTRARLPDWPDIAAGTGRVLVSDPWRIAPLICSEDLIGDLASARASQGSNLLVSIGSDAWFGGRAAAEQHFALACFRATENRRDMIRSTTNGISGHIDALGRVKARIAHTPAARDEAGVPTGLIVETALMSGRSGQGPIPAGLPWFTLGALGLLAIQKLCKTRYARPI